MSPGGREVRSGSPDGIFHSGTAGSSFYSGVLGYLEFHKLLRSCTSPEIALTGGHATGSHLIHLALS